MALEGGGWLVFQHRFHPFAENFLLPFWPLYREGFGDLRKEFWLGNENVHEITSCKKHQFLLWAKNEAGATEISLLNSFVVESEENNFRIQFNETEIKGLKSFANSSLEFTSKGHDNDLWDGGNCADTRGGFWFSHCGDFLPNHPTKPKWRTFDGANMLKETLLMVRPMQ